MYKKIVSLTICLLVLSISFSSISSAKEPKNLAVIKANLIQYYDSGEYKKDQAKIIGQAMQYLKARLAREKKSSSHKNFAIVLDVDETALSNYPNLRATDFGDASLALAESIKQGNTIPIQPTLNLYRYAKENNISVFFISERTEASRAVTEKNLTQAGFKKWNGILFKPETTNEKSMAFYKIEARQQIEKEGYDIILNIGDQQSDLVGKHADKTFKLPNPYYFTP